MRRLFGWMGGAVGGITAYRLLRRRKLAEPALTPTPAAAEPDERAEELRAKLAESRTGEELPAEPAEPDEEEPAAESESPEERRRRVHEEGRAALDDMKSDGAA